ncbi:hypothetical protein BGX28_006905 [Mortierella sp. GBA30]|nr:hypothetical protein BGX28_006905 [Mortierella sp. GBA30]
MDDDNDHMCYEGALPMWSHHHAGGIYRVPQARILQDFAETWQRLNNQHAPVGDMYVRQGTSFASSHRYVGGAGGTYRVPEGSILRDFVQKCQRSSVHIRNGRRSMSATDSSDLSRRNLNLLVAALMASEGGNEASTGSSLESSDSIESYEVVQDAVLNRLSSPGERQSYLHYRTLQRMVRENGVEESVRQWARELSRFQPDDFRKQTPPIERDTRA